MGEIRIHVLENVWCGYRHVINRNPVNLKKVVVCCPYSVLTAAHMLVRDVGRFLGFQYYLLLKLKIFLLV